MAAAAIRATIRPAMAVPLWSAAPPSFFEVVDTGATVSAAGCLSVGAAVVPADRSIVPVKVEFSWKIPPYLSAVTEADTDDEDEGASDDEEGTSSTEELEVEDEDEVVSTFGVLVVFIDVEDVVGGGAGADDFSFGSSFAFAGPSDPSMLKTTMLAVFPLGTVTTQKVAPPTPTVPTGLERPLTPPSVAGLMEQGRPLQPPSGHSIFTPKVGVLSRSGQSVKIGFHAIFKNVWPLASVFAPAT